MTAHVFDFRGGNMRITQVLNPQDIQAAFSDPETAELYYVMAPDAYAGITVVEIAGAETAYRPLLRWDYTHPNADPATGGAEGYWTSRVLMLPAPMAFSCARVICRRLRVADSLTTYEPSYNATARLTVTGRRYDSWDAASTGSTAVEGMEDDVLLIDAADVISGQPGVDAWAGEQRSKPFRIAANVLVDALKFELYVSGPVQIEAIYLAESMNDLIGG